MFKQKNKEEKPKNKEEKQKKREEKEARKAEKKDGKIKPQHSKSYEEDEVDNKKYPPSPPPPPTAPTNPSFTNQPSQSLSSPPPPHPPQPSASPRNSPPKEQLKQRTLSHPEEVAVVGGGAGSTSPPPASRYVAPATHIKTPAGDEQGVFLLKNKIANLPEGNRALVEYLISLFGKAIPSQWRPPPNLDVPVIDDQIDVTIDKLVEASEVLFNKDYQAMLKRYSKELCEAPKRRAQKWRILESLLSNNEQFLDTFLSSSTLEACVQSALILPLEDEEVDVLSDLLQHLLLRDMANKELLEVIKASSRSSEHITANVENNKSLVDSIVELVTSFKKQTFEFPNEEVPKEVDSARDGKKDIDPAIGTNQSISLLHHAMIIRHAKSGHDLSVPLESFFAHQIVQEEKAGQELEVTSKNVKEETTKNIQELDASIENESAILKDVLHEIKELEAKLVQKKAEQKNLEETLAKQEEARSKYRAEQEEHIQEIARKINESKTHLQHHNQSEESLKLFSGNIGVILRKEVHETIKKTKEVLSELDKEVLFLEDKMASYERSYALFSGADEPEVLDGLRKLKVRSQAIFAESLVSIGRVKKVVELLHGVVADGEEKTHLKEIEASLEQLVQRQTFLNGKYQLQK